MLEFIESSGLPKIWEQDPDAARASFRAMTSDTVTEESRVPVGSVEEIQVGEMAARVYRPETTGPAPTLVYLHGGGFVLGDLDTHDQTCRRLCRAAGAVVVSVDYRLAPEHPFPAGPDDAVAAVRWAHAHLDELGGSDVLAVGGDSAGGNLTTLACQALPDLVDAQILIYPAVDGINHHPSRQENGHGYFLDLPTMSWFTEHYIGESEELDVHDVRLAPLQADLAGQPRALVITAELDPLRDEGEAYADKLAAAGVEVDRVRYDGLIHGFLDMGMWSQACAEAVDDVERRVAKLLSAR